jgi:hypothetical protein
MKEESDMNVANTVIKLQSEAVDLCGKTVLHGDDELTIIAAPAVSFGRFESGQVLGSGEAL